MFQFPTQHVLRHQCLLLRPTAFSGCSGVKSAYRKNNNHPEIVLRQVVDQSKTISMLRTYSSSSSSKNTATSTDLVHTKLDLELGIAEITMQNGAVNSLSLEMCQALVASIQEVESNKKIQGMVLQSSGPTTFSAGLDIMEMHEPKIDRLRLFWSSFQNLYFTLYGSRLACVAAIEGHAPAAGCMLALSCDYRIMASTDLESKHQPKIGLNETKLGIVAPPWLAQQMIDCVGVRRAELALSLGELYSPEEALKINLVDKIVPKSDVRTEARKEASKWGMTIPPQARFASKLLIRQPHIDKLRATAEQDIDHFVQFITIPKVQQTIAGYLEMLTKKRK